MWLYNTESSDAPSTQKQLLCSGQMVEGQLLATDVTQLYIPCGNPETHLTAEFSGTDWKRNLCMWAGRTLRLIRHSKYNTRHICALCWDCKNISKERGAGNAEGNGMSTVDLIVI